MFIFLQTFTQWINWKRHCRKKCCYATNKNQLLFTRTHEISIVLILHTLLYYNSFLQFPKCVGICDPLSKNPPFSQKKYWSVMGELNMCLKKFMHILVALISNKALLKPTKTIHYWTPQLIRNTEIFVWCL